MPLNRLLLLLLVVIGLAAATIALALWTANALQIDPAKSIVGLSVTALIAAYGWRKYAMTRTQEPPRR